MSGRAPRSPSREECKGNLVSSPYRRPSGPIRHYTDLIEILCALSAFPFQSASLWLVYARCVTPTFYAVLMVLQKLVCDIHCKSWLLNRKGTVRTKGKRLVQPEPSRRYSKGLGILWGFVNFHKTASCTILASFHSTGNV